MKQSINVDITVPEGQCGHCRRELSDDEERLELEALFNGEPVHMTMCRSCMEEHVPGLLDEILQNGLCEGHDD